MEQQQRRLECGLNGGLIGQCRYRVEQRGIGVGQCRVRPFEEIKLVRRARHEDERLHDAVGLEGIEQERDAIRAVQFRCRSRQGHLSECVLPRLAGKGRAQRRAKQEQVRAADRNTADVAT